MSQAVEVKVPDIGDFKDVEVIEVLVKPGDTIAKDQSLVTVESDKASMEIPSSAAGVVKEMRVKLGDKVSQGSPLLVLEASGAVVPTPSPAPAPATAAAAPKPASVRLRRTQAQALAPRPQRRTPPARGAATPATPCRRASPSFP